MDRDPQTYIHLAEMDIIMDKASCVTKKVKQQPAALTQRGFMHFFVTQFRLCYRLSEFKKKVQREQKENIHIEKLLCDSYWFYS